MAAVYDAEGADELTFLDVTASSGEPGDDGRRRPPHRRAGVHPADRRRGHPDAGRRRPDAARGRGQGRREHRRDRPARAARRDGAAVRLAVLVLSVDARTVPAGSAPTPSGWEVTTHGGRRGTGIDAVEWAARGQELGVGEILLNSMDADGTRAGFDLKMIAAVRAAVDVPVIASGGAGAVEHFAPAVRGRGGRGARRERLPLRRRCGSARSRTRCAEAAWRFGDRGERAGARSPSWTRRSPRASSGRRTAWSAPSCSRTGPARC